MTDETAVLERLPQLALVHQVCAYSFSFPPFLLGSPPLLISSPQVLQIIVATLVAVRPFNEDARLRPWTSSGITLTSSRIS